MPQTITKQKKQCYFKSNNIKEIDYKDVELLKKFINSYGQILPSRRTGVLSEIPTQACRSGEACPYYGFASFS